MSGKFFQFNLSLPEELYQNLREVSSTQHVSMTHYIREALRARITTHLSGTKHCSTGEPCSMAVMAGAGRIPGYPSK